MEDQLCVDQGNNVRIDEVEWGFWLFFFPMAYFFSPLEALNDHSKSGKFS